MRCNEHKREFLGPCNWCGKKLCEMCIAKQEGKRYYCEHCAVALVPFAQRTLRPALAAKPVLVQAQQTSEAPAVKRRFVLGKDGYYELT